METKVNNSVFHTGGGDAFSHNIGNVYGDVHKHYYGSKPGKKEGILIWLEPATVDYTHPHKKAWNLRTDATGQWFLNSSQFKEWRDGVVRYLACKGRPGAGKTVMSSVVVESLRAHFQPNSGTVIFYLYVRNDERTTHSIVCVLSTLLLRVIEESSDVSDDVMDLYKECNRATRQDKNPDMKSVKAILEAELLKFDEVFIVIDALDEWDPPEASSNTPEQFIHILESLATNVKVMVTSRNRIPFSQDASKCCRDLIIGAQSQDIQAYLSERRRQGLFKRVDCSEEDMDNICRMIEDKAEGMFIVVQVVADSISVLPSMAEILDMLKHIDVANGLDGMWDLTLKRIDNSQDRELTFAFLAWLLYTEEISAVEIQHGLAEQLSRRRNDGIESDDRLIAVKHLLSISYGLVTVSQKSIRRKRRDNTQEACFQFVHFTAKESLSRLISKYVPRAQSALGLACLRYLSRCYLDANPVDTLKRYPLSRYALLHWHQHACKESCDHLVHELASKVYKNHVHLSRLLHNWHSNFMLLPRRKLNTTPEAYFLMSLAFHGPTCILRERWKDKFKTMENENRRTLLTFSAMGGITEAVQFLLAKGSNANQLDEHKRGPISYAAQYGHVEAVKLLLKPATALKVWNSSKAKESRHGLLSKARELMFEPKGAKLNIRDTLSTVPLIYAAEHGHEEVVKLLLDYGDDPDCLGLLGCTPISYAAENGHHGVVKLLLERGADPDRPDYLRRATISYAAENGNEDIVKLLLERGVDSNRPDSHGRSPISLAGKGIVKLFLERGADPDRLDNDGRALVSHAAQRGHLEVIKLLLERGAGPDQPDKDGRAPIIHAARRGRQEVVKLLLERGADPDRPDNNGRTPISHAAGRGSQAVFKLLLERGANPDRPDSFIRAPISYAAEMNRKKMVKFLLERGVADLDRLDKDDRTPISYAAKSNCKEVVEYLVDGGADPDRPDKSLRAPISYAAERGHEEVVKLLLERGACLDRPDQFMRAPISYAAAYRRENVVKLLLEQGADPERIDNYGFSPTTWPEYGQLPMREYKRRSEEGSLEEED